MGATDALYFRETIQLDPPSGTKPKVLTHRNIKAAYDTLKEKVEIAAGQITPQMDSLQAITVLKELRQTLVSDLIMARIPVTSQEAAFKIFTTLNDRGLRLSPPDLLLSYLMETATEADRPHIRSLWTEMIERMGTHDIDRFMRHMWVSQYGDLKKEDLFTALRNHIEKQRISSVDFARLCGDECDNYVQLVTVDEEQLPKDSLPFVRALTQELSFQPALPILLSCYRLLQAKGFIQVAKYLLVFVTRYSIIGNLDSGGMEDLLYKLARDIRSMVKDENDAAGSKQAVAHIKQSLAVSAPDDEVVKKAVVERVTLDSADAKYLVTRLARYMQDPTKEITLGETNLEHVYPQNPEPNEWGGSADQERLEPLTWHLGNLTIFGKRANRKAANGEFSAKLPRYQQSKVVMTQEIASKFDHWDEETIKQRASGLAKLVVEVWNFDNPSRV